MAEATESWARAPVALVTGGRRGIGRGSAFALADRGFDVVIADRERDADAEATLDGVASRGRRTAFVHADIGDLSAHQGLVDATVAALGSLDCLVNNAGVTVLQRGDMLEATPESWDHVMGVNLRGTFFLTQCAARWMLANPAESGTPRSIVMVSSVNAEVVSTTRAEYCVSKTGMSMMAKLFAVRLAESGIGVYEVRPGIIRTAMTDAVQAKYDAAIADGISPVRRWGEPEDVGRAVATLASGDLPFTVGQAVCVDGGLAIRQL